MQLAHDHVHHGAAKPHCLLLQSRTSTGRVLRTIIPVGSSHFRGGQAALAAVLGLVRSRVGRRGTTTAQMSCKTNGGQETPRDYKKSEIWSSWDHMEQAAFPTGCCLAQPLLYPCLPAHSCRRLKNLQGPCCWEIWLLKPQQCQWETQPVPWALQQLSPLPAGRDPAPQPPQPCQKHRSTMFATVRFVGKAPALPQPWGQPGTWATLVTPTRGRKGHSTWCTAMPSA